MMDEVFLRFCEAIGKCHIINGAQFEIVSFTKKLKLRKVEKHSSRRSVQLFREYFHFFVRTTEITHPSGRGIRSTQQHQ